mmetsp:Transcript_24909/g.69425  ORF Transcript_24909/g.69425 Transcript_24909/m.69425 type:complete len:312 (+) Transcript_24909:3240-4175(+)
MQQHGASVVARVAAGKGEQPDNPVVMSHGQVGVGRVGECQDHDYLFFALQVVEAVEQHCEQDLLARGLVLGVDAHLEVDHRYQIVVPHNFCDLTLLVNRGLDAFLVGSVDHAPRLHTMDAPSRSSGNLPCQVFGLNQLHPLPLSRQAMEGQEGHHLLLLPQVLGDLLPAMQPCGHQRRINHHADDALPVELFVANDPRLECQQLLGDFLGRFKVFAAILLEHVQRVGRMSVQTHEETCRVRHLRNLGLVDGVACHGRRLPRPTRNLPREVVRLNRHRPGPRFWLVRARNPRVAKARRPRRCVRQNRQRLIR